MCNVLRFANYAINRHDDDDDVVVVVVVTLSRQPRRSVVHG